MQCLHHPRLGRRERGSRAGEHSQGSAVMLQKYLFGYCQIPPRLSGNRRGDILHDRPSGGPRKRRQDVLRLRDKRLRQRGEGHHRRFQRILFPGRK